MVFSHISIPLEEAKIQNLVDAMLSVWNKVSEKGGEGKGWEKKWEKREEGGKGKEVLQCKFPCTVKYFLIKSFLMV